ncbi:HD domain-containing protein [Riemerella anatipestifer]|uniref:Polynucleotide adenylyltransferase/metal dependent phosphohydrolase n=1 Tax=Riemerella anatipestifer (strain ATCC 11845 / DSM 15868 / JCM 9532 / NCTC 11014) TaxID=693978 RepID=E4TDU0_RIEAD|nr:HD domain-containing protein [Riemerella anatipestifer]ADQ82949.1 polynucleotide adenylyltransferase/metal dependent phosphohydrolase [Riemerella anatipestifer ATCC 11845 = DSM 15868]AFD56962.1 polynucleotide adenylyltransferase/metal dependent phosphohydrolase [Riemerella anatipestifer ATCC 11845 = DSM 15868]MDD1524783.1 HD domain-containing protein [Riemerella anatipestifer]MRM92210.1 HD domain-containing protein [Riemerella anatipestifer]PST44318.1 HD domain-containing protein [Riemerell
MEKYINLNQNRNLKLFKTISKVAEERGQTAYIVGGYVRDLLMKRQVPTDIDFVTEQSGIELAQAVARELDSNLKVSVFKTYGTAMIKWKGLELEFVGARKESYSEDSRKPAVEQGSLEDDQKRRDFTINAMAISLGKEDFGRLVDPFGGVQDLESKILKTPLEPLQTYSDDPLRMMRAIRFASTLNFKVEQNSLDAIKQEADRIKIVSMERIMVEFNKIMLSEKPSIGLKLLDDTGLLEKIIPELTALKGIEEIEGQTHKDNFYHTLEVVDNISKHTDKLWLRWSALLHDIGKAPTKKFVDGIGWTFHGHEFLGSKMAKPLFQRLKLPLGADLKYVQKMVKLSSRPIALVTDDTSDAALRRLLFDAGEDLEDLFTLCKADITTKNTKKQERFRKNFEYVAQKIKEVEEKDQIRNFQPPISGEEIMALFQLKPGREIGILKEKVKEAILEGEISNTPEEAKDFVIKEAEKIGLKLSV